MANPADVPRDILAEDETRVGRFIQENLSGLARQYSKHSVCLYTMSPDQHFVVDRHPEHPHVAFAAGLSGHGFKFAPVLGRALAELVLDGGTDLPIGFLAKR